jgi:drug/metabolite transporter (DMT)-like permease
MSGVAIVTFNRAVSLLGSSAVTVIIALPPTVAAILSIPVLRETPSLAVATAIAVIVLGVLLGAKPAPAQDMPPVPQS